MYSGLCNVTTDVINDGGISSTQMKVDIAFRTQMTEQESGEGDMNAILKRDSKGGPNIMVRSGFGLHSDLSFFRTLA